MPDNAQQLDSGTIEELKGVMGEDFSLLIETFLNDSVARISAINDAVSSENPESIRRAAHGFKGSASNMGALNLAALCGSLEQLGRSGQCEGASQLAADIAEAYSVIKVELMSLNN